jgi:hypothetical protein
VLIAIPLLTVWTVVAVWAVAMWTDAPMGPANGGVEQIFDA